MGDGDTHDPETFDEDAEAAGPDVDAGRGDTASDTVSSDPEATPPDTGQAEAVDRTFDWRGWVLVAAIGVCFLLIPGVILAYPYVGRQLGLSFYDTYLALPMIPAVVLAALAVWATTRP